MHCGKHLTLFVSTVTSVLFKAYVTFRLQQLIQSALQTHLHKKHISQKSSLNIRNYKLVMTQLRHPDTLLPHIRRLHRVKVLVWSLCYLVSAAKQLEKTKTSEEGHRGAVQQRRRR